MAQARLDVGGNSTQKRRREQERRRSLLERASDYLRNVLPKETLSRGAVGESVRRLQQILRRIGYDVGPDDGVFGPRTEGALRAFQRGAGLQETGVYTPREREALARVVQAPERVASIAGGTGLLRLGSRGEAVRDLQTRLRELGFDPGPIDGVFGPRTAAAVRAFQESVGIRPDAIVGPVTRSALASIAEQQYRERVADVRRRLQARRLDEDVVGQSTRQPEQAQKRPKATPSGVPDASAELSPGIAEALRRLVPVQEVRKPSGEVERESPLAEFGEQILYGIGRALMLPELISAYRSATGQPTRPEDVFEAPEGTAERIGDFIGQVLGQLGFFLATGPVGGALSLGGRMLGRAGLQAATKGLARAGARELAESQAARTLGEALRRLAPVAEGAYEAAIRGGLYGAYQQAARELAVPDEADFAQRLQNALRTAGYFGAYGSAYQVARPVVGRIGQEIGRRAPALQRAAETIAQRSPLASELTRGAAEGGLAGTLVGLGQAGVGVATGQPVQAAVAQVPQEAREEISENIVEAIALRLAQILGGRLGAAPVAPTQPAQQEQAAQRVAPQQTEQPAPQPQATTPPQQTAPTAPQQAERPVTQPQAATPPQQPTPAAPQQQPASRAPEQPAPPVAQPQAPAAPQQQQPTQRHEAPQAPTVQQPPASERPFAGLRPGDLLQGRVPVTDFGDLTPHVEYVPLEWVKQFGEPRSYQRGYVRRAAQQLEKKGFQRPLILHVGRDGRAILSDDSRTALQLAAAEYLGLQEVPVIVQVRGTVPYGVRANIRPLGEETFVRPSVAFADLPSAKQVAQGQPEQGVVGQQAERQAATPAAPQQQTPATPERAPSVPAQPEQPTETQQPAAASPPVPPQPERPAQAPAPEPKLRPEMQRVIEENLDLRGHALVGRDIEQEVREWLAQHPRFRNAKLRWEPAGGRLVRVVLAQKPDVLQGARTGEPIRLRVFRGFGRADRDAVYTVPGIGPVLGQARYYAFDRSVAERFGPQVEEVEIEVRNPLVIRSDEEWRELTRAAGLEYPNPLRIDNPEKAREDIERVRNEILRRGHDSVIVLLTPSSQGDKTKTLNRVFGDSQLVVFESSQARIAPPSAEHPQPKQTEAAPQQAPSVPARPEHVEPTDARLLGSEDGRRDAAAGTISRAVFDYNRIANRLRELGLPVTSDNVSSYWDGYWTGFAQEVQARQQQRQVEQPAEPRAPEQRATQEPAVEREQEPEPPAATPAPQAQEEDITIQAAAWGNETRIFTPTNQPVRVRYALVDADNLIASHTTSLSINPEYPQELQPRDRTRAASHEQVAQVAANLTPELLGAAPTTADGAPVVGPDGVVESGNGRTIALKRVYEDDRYVDRRRAYREWLRREAASFGLRPEDVDRVGKPVLVRVRVEPVPDRVRFAQEAGESTVSRMGAAEQALLDARLIDDELLGMLDPEAEDGLLDRRNEQFVRAFVRRLPPGQRADMWDRSGKLSPNGERRIRNALLAKAYGDPTLLERLVESTDAGLKNVDKALWNLVVRAAKFRGTGRKDLDITSDMAQAANKLWALRQEGMTVEQYLLSPELFESLTPVGKRILQIYDQYKRSAKNIAAVFERYFSAAEAAGAEGQIGLFEARSPIELLDTAVQQVEEFRRGQTGQQSILAEPTESAGTGEADQRSGTGVPVEAGAGGEVPVSSGARPVPRTEGEVRGRPDGRESEQQPAGRKSRKRGGEGEQGAPRTQERKAPARKQERQAPAVKPNPEVEQAVAGKDIAVLEADDVRFLTAALPHLSKAKSLTIRTDVRVPRSVLVSIRQALRGWEAVDNGDGTITFMPPDNVARDVSAFYDTHGVRPGEDVEWAKRTATEALMDLEGTVAAVAVNTTSVPRGATGSGARLLALGIRTDLVRQGWVDFRGKQVRSPADLAALAQVVRDPRFETFRIFYVKGDTIVGQEAVTSRLPDAVYFWPRSEWAKHRERIRRRMERLGADGYYLLHNHPSGNAKPSSEDLQLTERWAQSLPGFRGHVVIDSGHYAVIRSDGEVEVDTLGDWQNTADQLLSPAVDHPLLGVRLMSPKDVAAVGRALYFGTKDANASMPVLLYTDSRLRVRAIQQIPEGLLRSTGHAANYIRGRAREFGAPYVFLFHTKWLDDGVLAKLIHDGVLTDAVMTNRDGTSAVSLRDLLWIWRNPQLVFGLPVEHYVVRDEGAEDLIDVGSFFADVVKKATQPRRPQRRVRLAEVFQQLELPMAELVDRTGKPTPAAVIDEEKRREVEAAAAGIIEARPDVKAPKVPDVLSDHPDIAAPLMPHQREGVNLAMQALKTGPRGFFLADGTGAGKTMQGLAIAMLARRQGAQRVLILTEREKIVDDAWLKDVQRFGPELAADVKKWKPGLEKEPGIYVSWYPQLRVKRPIPLEGWDLVIFDEAHNLKNVLKGTTRAVRGVDLERSTPMVVYLSATPVDRPTDFRYFGHRLGLFADDDYDSAFDEWVLRLGLQPRWREVRDRRTGRTRMVKDYVRLPGVTWEDVAARIDEQMAELKRQGRMLKREVPLEGLEVVIQYRPLSPEAQEVQETIIREFGGENARGLKRAQQITLLRRHLENFKIPDAVELARRELAEGRQVVIFAGYKEESAAEKRIFVGTLYGGEAEYIWETIHKSESVIKQLREELEKIVGKGNVAELHGGIRGEPKPDVNAEIQAYQSGKKRVAIATLDMASTGVSLHDETGRAPRTQIMLTLPWSAMQHVQAAGRSHRLTSKSKTRLYVLTTDSAIDNLLSSVLAAKMKVLKATVRGDLDRIDLEEGQKRIEYGGGMLMDEISSKMAGEPDVEVGMSPSTALYEDVGDLDTMLVDETDESDLDALIPRPAREKEQPSGAQAQHDPYAMAPQTRREIIKFVMDKLGPYVGTGRLRVKKALGQYDRRQEVIRLKYAEDLPTLMHELGHYFDDKLGLRRRAGRYAEELISLGEATSPEGASVGYRFKEGIAQFLRFWVTGEQDVRLLAPGFNKFWGQLLEANPEFKEAMERLRDMTRAYLSLPPVEKVRRSISFAPLPKERPTMSQALWSFFEQAYKMMVDNLYPLQKLTMALSGGNPLPITKDPGRLAALMRGHLGKVEAWLYKGQFTFRNDTLEKLGPSLAEILKPVSKTKEDLEDFITYAVAKVRLEYARVDREINKKRAEQGLPPLPMREFPFSEEEAKEVVRSLETPEREKALRQLTEYRRNLTRELEAAGIIPEGRVDEFEKMYRYNLPFYREMDVGTDETVESRRGTGRTFADLPRVTLRLRGSSRTIINPLHSLIRDTYFYLNLAHRNRVMLTAVDLARKTKGMGKLIEVDLPPKVIPFKRDLVNMAEILRAELEKAGSAFDPADPVDWQAIFKALEGRSIVEFRTSYQKGGREAKEHIVVYMEGGQPKFARVDREVYQALLGLDVDTSPLWARLMGADLVRLFRSGVTMAPEFIVRNIFRDVFSTMVFSEAGINPVDWVRGLFSALRRDDLYWKWKASGGSRGEMTTFDRDSLQEALKDIADLKQPSMTRRMLSASIAWVRRLLEATEAAGRIAEFDKNLRKMARKKKGALTEADYLEAAERSRMQVNVDFARAGTVTRELNRVVPFYNAAVQEIDLIARSFVRHPWRTFFRAVTYITLPTLLLYILNRDDETYWELPQWRRDLFWNIPLGNGYFVSLPIPFLIGALFKTVPERIFQWIDRNDPEAFDELGRRLAEAGAPGTILSEKFPIPLPIPHLFLGMLELYANRRTFSSVPIVPERELRLPPELQYGPYTPETAKLVGRWLGISPRKVDYFFAAYGGSLGQGALRGVDFALERVGLVKPVPRPRDVKGMWFVGDFVTDELASSLDRFYRDFEEAETRYNGYRARLEQGQRVDITREEFAQLYQRVRLMRRVSRKLSDLRKEQRKVLAHPTMAPEQKAEALRQIELTMTNLVRYAYGKQPLEK